MKFEINDFPQPIDWLIWWYVWNFTLLRWGSIGVLWFIYFKRFSVCVEDFDLPSFPLDFLILAYCAQLNFLLEWNRQAEKIVTKCRNQIRTQWYHQSGIWIKIMQIRAKRKLNLLLGLRLCDFSSFWIPVYQSYFSLPNIYRSRI